MSEKKSAEKKNSYSPDWLVRGVLTKIGDTFDRITGRGWKPSSSLATSELIEKLKSLLDSEVKDLGGKGRFVPHNIKLKMQWDKFSTDLETTLKTLENELLTAAIDHINDHRYHTFAPFNIEVKPDYFTEGVTLLSSFDKFSETDEEAALKVSIPNMNVSQLIEPESKPQINDEMFTAEFMQNGLSKSVRLNIQTGKRLSVGRSKENDLPIEDGSVSKIHASLVLNSQNQLLVADTGSTNGTFINDERIAYGKAFPIENGVKVKFGTVEVTFKNVPKPVEIPVEAEPENQNSFVIDGFEFKSRSEINDFSPEPENKVQTNSKTDVFGTEQRISFDFENKDK